MYHIPRPTVMSSGAHDSSNATYGGVPEELSYLIEYWAKAHLASYDDDQSSAQGLRYLDQYWTGVGRAKGDLTRKGGRRLPRVVVGRRPRVASSPSQDI